MYDKICTKHRCPDSLFDKCLRQVSKDVNNIQPNQLLCLPSYIKRNILKYATGYLFRRLGGGFKDNETLKALLNKEIMNLELTNAITTDYTLQNISDKSAPRELTFGGSNCTFTEIAFKNFIPTMKNLTFLSLKGLANITDVMISGLTELEHLKHLNLQKCFGLTDDCGKTLRNTKLEKLDMSYTLITDVWLCLLDGSQLNESLIDLNLSFCKGLTNDHLKKLNWEKLKYAGLFGLNGLEFMDNLGKLKNVQFTIPF